MKIPTVGVTNPLVVQANPISPLVGTPASGTPVSGDNGDAGVLLAFRFPRACQEDHSCGGRRDS